MQTSRTNAVAAIDAHQKQSLAIEAIRVTVEPARSGAERAAGFGEGNRLSQWHVCWRFARLARAAADQLLPFLIGLRTAAPVESGHCACKNERSFAREAN